MSFVGISCSKCEKNSHGSTADGLKEFAIFLSQFFFHRESQSRTVSSLINWTEAQKMSQLWRWKVSLNLDSNNDLASVKTSDYGKDFFLLTRDFDSD